ncbi:MAG: TetR/AcrR family transcriptional regulator [Actinomycetota bacterium]
MSGPAAPTVEAPRRVLTERQAEIVQRLTDAAVVEIRANGYEGLTVRNVAARAGVAAATAYTYFGSKDHLIAETFWRRIRALPDPRIDRRKSPAVRVKAALSDLTRLLAGQPELAAASTSAMLATDPDVKHIRDRVGAHIRRRLEDALGDDDGDAVLTALELAVAGAMIRAGMGHLAYAELPGRIAGVAGLLLKERR